MRLPFFARLLLAFSSLLPPAFAESEPIPLATVPELNVERYLGVWYEIAKYPNRFQRKCVAETSAQYSLLANGNIQVINRCRLIDGQFEEAVGEARQLGPRNSPRLEVRFAPAWLSFLPAVWGDYWVIDLDPEYQLVAVGEPRREFLWILARTPRVEASALSALRDRLAQKGFKLERLEMTAQAASRP